MIVICHMPIIIWHTQVIIGHGNLTPSCLTRGSTGSLQFTGQWRQYNRVGALEIDANNNLKQTTFVTGLEHCGPAWQPLEIATLFLSLAGLHKLEVKTIDHIPTKLCHHIDIKSLWQGLHKLEVEVLRSCSHHATPY